MFIVGGRNRHARLILVSRTGNDTYLRDVDPPEAKESRQCINVRPHRYVQMLQRMPKSMAATRKGLQQAR